MLKLSLNVLWSGQLRTVISKLNQECKYISAHCGKLPLPRVDPYKEQLSKCSKDYNKHTNKSKIHFHFHKPQFAKKEIDYEMIQPMKLLSSCCKRLSKLGSTKSCLASCTCPLAYKNQIQRQDSSYQSTSGNGFIYTEYIKSKKLELDEPQPRTTPLYKIPRSALCKMIIEECETNLCECIIPLSHNSYTSCKLKPIKIPFEEMRPQNKEKETFTCKDGVNTEDIMYPFNTAMNPSKECLTKVIKNSQTVIKEQKTLTNL